MVPPIRPAEVSAAQRTQVRPRLHRAVARQQKSLLTALEQKLVPFEEMLMHKPFLLDERPRFVDFDLFGMLGNFLYSGHYRLPAAHTQLKRVAPPHGRC